MEQNQKEILLLSFIISQVSYTVPFFGCFASKNPTKKTNAVHKRSLRIILNDCESPYPLLAYY